MKFWVRVGTTRLVWDTVLTIEASNESEARLLAKQQLAEILPRMKVKDCLEAVK